MEARWTTQWLNGRIQGLHSRPGRARWWDQCWAKRRHCAQRCGCSGRQQGRGSTTKAAGWGGECGDALRCLNRGGEMECEHTYMYDQWWELKKAVSALHRMMKTYLKPHPTFIHHPPVQTRPQYCRTNPWASSSRGRGYLIRAATTDLPATTRTWWEYPGVSRMPGRCQGSCGAHQYKPKNTQSQWRRNTHQRVPKATQMIWKIVQTRRQQHGPSRTLWRGWRSCKNRQNASVNARKMAARRTHQVDLERSQRGWAVKQPYQTVSMVSRNVLGGSETSVSMRWMHHVETDHQESTGSGRWSQEASKPNRTAKGLFIEPNAMAYASGVTGMCTASKRTTRLGGWIGEQAKSRVIKGDREHQSNGDGDQRGGRRGQMDDTTSGTHHDSKRVGTTSLAEDQASQHRWHKHEMADVPRTSTPPTTYLRQFTDNPTPPHHHGWLKSQPTRVRNPRKTYQVTRTHQGCIEQIILNVCKYSVVGKPAEVSSYETKVRITTWLCNDVAVRPHSSLSTPTDWMCRICCMYMDHRWWWSNPEVRYAKTSLQDLIEDELCALTRQRNYLSRNLPYQVTTQAQCDLDTTRTLRMMLHRLNYHSLNGIFS